MKNYNKLEKKFARITKINQANALLSWDEQVNMPSGASLSRAQVMAEIQLMAQEVLLDNNIPELLENALTENLNTWQISNLRLMERKYTEAIAIPPDLNSAWIMAVLESTQAWRELRSKNDWQSYLPLFKKVVNFSKERGEALASTFGVSTYDALLGTNQEGIDDKLISDIFSDIKTWLPEFIQKAKNKQTLFIPSPAKYAIADQKALCIEIMKEIGFDFMHGRLDVSHHPFCGGVPSDVRLTTRYSEDNFTKSLMATIHETGHALYEQGLPHSWEFQPVGNNLGMSIHESQSLLFEMQIARSPEFLSYLAPKIQKYFTISGEYNTENLCKLYYQVKPGYIRVDADEITYPAHVILRYEIEKNLMEGNIKIEDVPELWNEKMQSYLGIDTKGNYKDGCMQDVHWPSGIFGYFPSYTLGAIMAAQLFASIKRQYPDINSDIAAGDLTKVKDWLANNIWSKASSLSPEQILVGATGETLTSRFFKEHLITRYKLI